MNLAEGFADMKVVCSDGLVLWNRSLLAASSSFLRQILTEDDSFLIIDSFSCISVSKCFSVIFGEEPEDILDVDEVCIIYDILKMDVHVKREANVTSVGTEVFVKHEDGADFQVEILFEDAMRDRVHKNEKQTKHSARSFYTCRECEFTTKSKNVIESHHRKKHSKGWERIACRICGKIFTTQNRVESHEKRMHSMAQGIKCNFCDQTLRSKDNLKLHMELLHTAEDQLNNELQNLI